MNQYVCLESPQSLELLQALPALKVAQVRVGRRVLSELGGVDEALAAQAAHEVLQPRVQLEVLGAVRLGLEGLGAVGPAAVVGVGVGVLGLVAVQLPPAFAAEWALVADDGLDVVVAAAHVRLEG